MRRLKRYARLSGAEIFYFLRALFVVGTARVGLWLLPIGTMRRIAGKTADKEREPHAVQRLTWSVRAASRYVPAATCLTQALALQYLLGRFGYGSKILVGARKDTMGKLESHAWVECEGQVVIGGPQSSGYFPLTTWES